MVTGEDTWCHSSANQGADRTWLDWIIAVQDGAVLVVNGRGLELRFAVPTSECCGDELGAPRRKGISWMVLPMHQSASRLGPCAR